MVEAEPDHRAFLAQLAPDMRARLTARSDGAGLRHLSGHVGAILACGIWIGLGWPLWWVLLPVQGVLLVFLFTLEHECTHQTPFANARLNEAVGHCCGVVLLLPFHWFRAFHLAHHRWTNLEGQDPELDAPKPESLQAWLWHVSGMPVWMSAVALLLRLARRRETARWLGRGAQARAEREARVLLGLYVLAAASLLVTPLMFWVWIVPMVLGQPALRLYLLAEHGDCPRVAAMFANTRTTFTIAPMRWLAWNMPYHTEHHVWPQVPFHQLPQLHDEMKVHLQVTADGYAGFTRAYLARRIGR